MQQFDAPSPPYPPLAIIGFSCLFPKAETNEQFWSNLRRGVDAITEIPPTHWDPQAYYDADPKAPDRTYARRGGFLSPVPFDPLEFGIAPSNLEAIDTSQLLGLVAAKRALEHAGYGDGGKPFDRQRASCILGVTGTLEMVIPLGARLGHPKWRKALADAGVAEDVAEDVIQRISESYVPWQENSFPGLLGNVVAGRIANRLNLGGTNCVVDAACASSLSAIHLAALELWTGRSDLVLTGGVDTFNDIFMYMCFSKTPALSPTGDARPFAEEADGTILGEGVGLLVLKRLADAQRDGDQIYALIRSIGTSSDGAGNAVYAPKKEGQIRCLQEAYRLAGVSPDTIELIEAHGTGTKVGDATELAGLKEVFRASGRTGRWCALGSVKSQIGHTKAAAGVAGVLKAMLALHHRVLPPTIKVERPLPGLLEPDCPFYLNTEARPWLPSAHHPRRAGVSAFGFGGSNFHCVLEEAPAPQAATLPANLRGREPRSNLEPDWDSDVLLLAFSGATRAELQQQIQQFHQACTSQGTPTADVWRYRATQLRAAFDPHAEHRLVLVIEPERTAPAMLLQQAAAALEKYADKSWWSTPDGVFYGRGSRPGKLAVLFPGQGSQAVGMLRELACRFPVMQTILAEADEAFAALQGGTQRLSDYIYPPPAFSEEERLAQEAALRATQIAQPALGAVSLAALAVLEHFGVKPEVTAGHSYGELTALCASQRFQPQALYRLSMLRGRLMAEAQEVDGGMCAVGGPLSQIEAALKEAAVELVIANRNAPQQVVLSGRITEIDRATELFTRRNLRIKRLPVSAAFHSPFVATASQRFRPVLSEVTFAPSDVPVYANSNAEVYPADPEAARDLLAGQLAQPVEWVRLIENMYAAGARVFLEVGPGSVLTGLVGAILSGREHRALAIDASLGKRSGMVDLALVLAQLAASGYPLRLAAWDPHPPVPSTPPADRLCVPICGANYVKPRPHRPPRPRPQQADTASSPKEPQAQPVLPPSRPPADAAPEPAQAPSPAPAPAAVPSLDSHHALLVLQQMQQETARLHRQFLESQTAAMNTLERLLGSATLPPLPAIPSNQTVLPVAPAAHTPPASATPPRAVQPKPTTAPSPTRSSPPAPAQVAPPVATSPAEGNALTATVLAVIAEKTGYPVEMLQPTMSLDHDLGIDSIKRVEILSALQEKLPEVPAATPEQLQTLHRVQDIIELLGSHRVEQPAERGKGAVPPERTTVEAGPSATELTSTVLAVIAEKTGYPVEMLQPTMSLDHDLGIDSIKRVEILSALQEKLPEVPAATPEQLQTLHRVQDIIDLLGSHRVEQPAVRGEGVVPLERTAVEAGPSATDLTSTVLAVIAEKTGYPVEMLQPTMSLDHDLGIDSIKRVEILSALQEKLPEVPAATPEQLQTLHRVQDIIDLLAGSKPASTASLPLPSSASQNNESNKDHESDLLRGVVRVVPVHEPRQPLNLLPGGVFWLVSEPQPLADALAQALRRRGFEAHLAAEGERLPSTLTGVVFLPARGGTTTTTLWRALAALQAAGPMLKRTAAGGFAAVVATVSRLDGQCGFDPLATRLHDPISGGLAGLAKTVRHEWPELVCKAIDLGPDWSEPQAAEALAEELLHTGPLECGLSPQQRVKLQIAQTPLPRASVQLLAPGDVVLVTGGARGVTAAAALALAEHYRPRMIMCGRSPAPQPEPDWLRDLHDEARIKQGLAQRQLATTPRELQERCRNILAQREIAQTLTRLRGLGVTVDYYPVDVRRADDVAELLARVRREAGPIRGVLHGAGVLADQRLEDKTQEQFLRVYETKVHGLQAVLQAVEPDELRVLAVFSSFTGRYGRTGQVDYAMANEALNKLAQDFQRRHRQCRVVAFNWGPWDGGMVQGGLKTLFAKEAVGLIPLAAGAEFLVHELAQPVQAAADVEVLVLGPGSQTLSTAADHKPSQVMAQPDAAGERTAPAGAAPGVWRVAWERTLSPQQCVCLADHVLGGKAVLPVALMVELLGHAALLRNPGLEWWGLERLQVFKGLRWDADETVLVQVQSSKPQRLSQCYRVAEQLGCLVAGQFHLHSSAEVVLGEHALPAPEEPPLDVGSLEPWHGPIYAQLFHGPAFQGLEQVEGLGPAGIVVRSRSAPAPAEWLAEPWRSHWLADPLALDGALQAVILWSLRYRGVPCLPMGLADYRQFARRFPQEGVHIRVRIIPGSGSTLHAAIEFRSLAGQLVARIADSTHVADASLLEAFRRNHLAAQATAR